MSYPACILRREVNCLGVHVRRGDWLSGVRHTPGHMLFFCSDKDGRVHQYLTFKAVPPSSPDPITKVHSKDVIIDSKTGVSARLYLPYAATHLPKNRKLPILVYYHRGAFCCSSAFSSTTHAFLNSLVSRSGAVAVSIEYRLPPENPIPALYQDAWGALNWVARQAGECSEPWLSDHGDFTRIFLSGASAGANIAHNVAMAAAGSPAFEITDANHPSSTIKIAGLVVIHPYFLEYPAKPNPLMDLLCPSMASMDNPLVNLVAETAPGVSELGKSGCTRVLIFVAGVDHLGDRARFYRKLLSESEWGGEVELVEHEGEDHGSIIRSLMIPVMLRT